MSAFIQLNLQLQKCWVILVLRYFPPDTFQNADVLQAPNPFPSLLQIYFAKDTFMAQSIFQCICLFFTAKIFFQPCLLSVLQISDQIGFANPF